MNISLKIKKILNKYGGITFYSLFLKLKGLIVFPIVVRIFGIENYGILSQITAFKNLLVSFGSLRMQAAYIKHASGKNIDTQIRDFWGTLFFIGVVNSFFLIIVIMYKYSISELIFGKRLYPQYALIATSMGFLYVIYDMLVTFKRTLNQFNKAGIMLIIFESAYLIALLCVIVLNVSSLLEFMIFNLLLQFAILLIYLSLYLIDYKPQKIKLNFKIIKMGLFLTPIASTRWIINWIDRFFITHFLGLKMTGVYSVAKTFISFVWIIPYIVLYVYYPTISRAWNQKDDIYITHKFTSSIVILTYAVFVSGLTISLLGGWSLNFLLKKNWI